jgi:hypothetical protein
VANSFDFPFFTNVNTASVGAHGGRTLDLQEPSEDNIKKQSYFTRFGEGSIQDVQILLKKYHLNLGLHQKQLASDLMNIIIPKLEELQRDLVIKIREIKSLSNDFKDHTLLSEIALTGQLLNDYIDAMRNLTTKGDCSKDPYLLRLRLELQLKQQLHVENYLEEAFMNLQVTSLMLEKIIYKEIQRSLNQYSELISQEIFIHYNDLINELHQGIISKTPYFEWDNFIEKDNNKTFLKFKHNDSLPAPKKISDLVYPFNNSVISKTVRSGHLLKKTKILKTYSKSFFILTLNYLHEFRTSKLDGSNIVPIHSIKLNDSILVDHNENKFQLKVRVKNEMKKITTMNFVFKNCDSSPAEFQKWVHDLKGLTSFDSFNERYEYISRKIPGNQSGLSPSVSNQLYPASSNNISILSRAQTPRLEIDNPMDIAAINLKLENLQMSNHSSSTPASQSDGSTHQPQPPPHFPQHTSTRGTNSSNLSIETRPSLLNVPALQIQEPTPTRPIAPRLPSQTSIKSTNSLTATRPALQHRKTNSTSSSVNISRSGTPMIGSHNTANNAASNLSEEELRIKLNESIYDENGHQVDLSELLNQMK